MSQLITGLLVAAAALTAVRGATLDQEPAQVDVPKQEASASEHEWLLQLVGEWDATWDTEPGNPDGDATWKSHESIKAVGDLWIVAEGEASGAGLSFTSMLTIGYDPAEEAFVGSWIDSIQTRMWTYRGTLDEERRVLTLAAEGPSMTDPTKTAKYEDRIELIDADHKRITSVGMNDKGEWEQYMQVNFTRSK
jgi:hypothetical protein